MRTCIPTGRGTTSNYATAYSEFIKTPLHPTLTTTTLLPGEILEHILQCLCIPSSGRWLKSSYDRSLGLCSLTCRLWAEHIRPPLFLRIEITSREKACAFSALIRSSVGMAECQWSLYKAVHEILLRISTNSRPWLYYAWSFLHGGALRKLETIRLYISAERSTPPSELPSEKCPYNTYVDVGFPRTLPWLRPTLQLKSLHLINLKIHSSYALLRCFTYHRTDFISFKGGDWLDDSADESAPTRNLLRRLRLHTPTRLHVTPGSRPLGWSSQLLWALFTTDPSSTWMAGEPLYMINDIQISAVMCIVRLFANEYECKRRTIVRGNIEFRVYPGELHTIKYI